MSIFMYPVRGDLAAAINAGTARVGAIELSKIVRSEAGRNVEDLPTYSLMFTIEFDGVSVRGYISTPHIYELNVGEGESKFDGCVLSLADAQSGDLGLVGARVDEMFVAREYKSSFSRSSTVTREFSHILLNVGEGSGSRQFIICSPSDLI